jgi:cytochrome c-type biogenesis protein CcmF
MENIQYINEDLWPGYLGHFAIVTSFVAALLAAVAYFMATQKRNEPESDSWRRIGRWAFGTHGLATFFVIGLIFYLMIYKQYEYQYVWQHVSDELPFRYIFAAFWEGQEGSFLLWMFWHVVLGAMLIFTAKKWETSTLATLSLIQVVIASMLLGVYLGWGDDPTKVGSNPLLLLRYTMDIPLFKNAEYLKLIKGNGLNPSLQNYWMVIHPPTLFLGFASTSIPFVFAIAGLWLRQHTEWMKPALSWALFSGAILGTGILMGGAWAYEALNFGGYWAWDPVENMSLVPWIILIAGIHTNLVARSTGQSIRSTYMFYLLSFLMVIYSTFLTRSGVLGDTSVHAFTNMGLGWQLVAFLGLFLLMSILLMAVRYREIPTPAKEEALASKEFWIFFGSLVFLFSAILIAGSTSLPVFNKIMQYFDPTYKGRVITEAVEHYNKYQVYIAFFIGLFSGFAQYLRWKEPNWKANIRAFLTHSGAALVLACGLSYLTSLWIEMKIWQHWLVLISAYFTVIANLDYLIFVARGNMKLAGSAFSHFGFGVMIVGILASGVNKKIISSNPFMMEGLIEGADEMTARKNILLFKDAPMEMNGYLVTYLTDTLDGLNRTFTVNFQRKDKQGKTVETFDLYPNILYDKSYTKIAASNPSTEHYWHKDIFVHIPSLPEVEQNFELKKQKEDSLKYKPVTLALGQVTPFADALKMGNQDSISNFNYQITMESVDLQPKHKDYNPEAGDKAFGVKLKVQRNDDDRIFFVEPVIVLREQLVYTYSSQIDPLSAKIRLNQEAIPQVFSFEQELNYQTLELGVGANKKWNDLNVTFNGFDRQPKHPDLQLQNGDLAVGAKLDIRTGDGKTYQAEPVFLIRDGQPGNLKVEVPELGLHLRFALLSPKTESIQLLLAKSTPKGQNITVEVASDSLRSDYIVLEAILFPGINLFWAGSLLMMIGLAFSMFQRLRSKLSAQSA